MSNKSHYINRRKFIGQAGCAALGTTGLLSTLLNLGLASRVQAYNPVSNTPGNNYKAMICIFLLGGNDSWNMVIPTGSGANGEFATYQNLRGNLALPATGTRAPLPLNTPYNISGRSFGVHYNLPKLQGLFNNTTPNNSKYNPNSPLSFVANVGSLVRPILSQADSLAGNWPLGLYSHSDQQQQWQSCMPSTRSAIGWAGLAQDIFKTLMPSVQPYTFNISMGGSNILQTGNSIVPYSVGYNGAGRFIDGTGFGISQMDSGAGTNIGDQTTAVNGLMSQIYQNVFDSTYAQVTKDARDAYSFYQTQLGGTASNGYQDINHFPSWSPSADNRLEVQLKQAANMIHAFGHHDVAGDTTTTPNGTGAGSGVLRQTFFISMGGFDTHHNLLNDQPGLFSQLDDAIGNFWAQIQAAGLDNQVTLFTASDFGRTLTTNGSGADHAWGGNHIVLSGDPFMYGGNIFGYDDSGSPNPIFTQYPFFDGGLLDRIDAVANAQAREGRLIPGLAVEEYMHPILSWYGLAADDIYNYVFPAYLPQFGTGGNPATAIRTGARYKLFADRSDPNHIHSKTHY